jgi:hypothetical protein
MVYMLVLTFTDPSNCFSYLAYSSTEAGRTSSRVRKDIFWQIGYQESHPEDKNTIHGQLEQYKSFDAAIPLEERGDVVRCVIKPTNYLHTGYQPIGINQIHNIPVSDGHARPVQHLYIQPNPMLDSADDVESVTLDSDSDSDSD